MGRTYRCIIPTPNGILMPVMQPVDHVSTCNLKLEDTKATRDRKQCKEKKGVVAEELLQKELELYKKKLTFHEKLNTDLTNCLVKQDANSKIKLDAVKYELLKVKDELLEVKQDLRSSQATANHAKSTANQVRRQNSSLSKFEIVNNEPKRLMTAIMSQLTVQNLQSGVLMDGIASSLASKKYLRRFLSQAISNNENLSPILKKNFEHRLILTPCINNILLLLLSLLRNIIIFIFDY